MRIINVKYFQLASSITANLKTFELRQKKIIVMVFIRYYDAKVEKLI